VKVSFVAFSTPLRRRKEGDKDRGRLLTEGKKTEQEPYDGKLGQKLLSLSSQIEHLTLHLANLRREAPAKAAAAYASTLQDEDSTFQQSRITSEQEARQRIQEEQDLCGVKDLRDWDECERNWRTATEGLVGVKEGIGATGARLMQARDVVEYLEKKGGK
jgi:kinetochor protein Mis14/NSL1